ncbi:XRE family transcriptional regulator [Bartonella apis]|uniref:XRE family transcriptional regulator n=1 Tax=Bartonella apis TaxID=1686310 RepID=UPI003997C19D
MSLNTRIFEARKKAHLTQQDLASRLNVTKAAVSSWERGTSPRQEKLEAIAKATNVSYEWLLIGTEPIGEDSVVSTPNGVILPNIDFSTNKTIPVYGQAVAGINGEVAFDGKKLFEVPCPPQLLNVENAYGVEVAGDTMSPRYEDGEIVYVDTVRRIKKGDYVVAQIMMREEDSFPTAFIKRFIRHDEQELVLTQLNPAKELVFPHQHVLSVHYIALAGEGL